MCLEESWEWKANAIYDKHCDNDPVSMDKFVTSVGWCDKFMKGNGLSMRRGTTTAQKDPAHMANKIVAYILIGCTSANR